MTKSSYLSAIASILLISATAFGQSSSVLSAARERANQRLQAYDAGRY